MSEIQFRDDPDAALARFREVGFHVEYGVWRPRECAALIAAAEALRKASGVDYAPLMQGHRTDPVFLGALRSPEIVRVIERLVGGVASGLQSQFFFGCPGTRGFARHQDNSFVRAGPDVFAPAWSALTEVAPESGGLYVYPGSHREPILPVRMLEGAPWANQDPNAANHETIVPDGYTPLDVWSPKGSVIFLHGNVIHGSYANRSDRFRYSLLCTYIRQGEPFRPGRHARREEVALHA